MSTSATELRIADIGDRFRREMYEHVLGSPEHEVGGVLVGRLDGRTGQPRVTGVIAALEAVGERASVTFTHEAWETIIERQEEEFPNTQIVGWYHSHPGFGIFLSEHDLFIHRNFFGDAHQFAYVIDPLELTEGVFGWRDGDVAPFDERKLDQADLGGEAAEPAAAAAKSAPKIQVDLGDLLDDEPIDEAAHRTTVDLDETAPYAAPPRAARAEPARAVPGGGLGVPTRSGPPVDPLLAERRRARTRRLAAIGGAAVVLLVVALVAVVGGKSSGGGSVSDPNGTVDPIQQRKDEHAQQIKFDAANGQVQNDLQASMASTHWVKPTPAPVARPSGGTTTGGNPSGGVPAQPGGTVSQPSGGGNAQPSGGHSSSGPAAPPSHNSGGNANPCPRGQLGC